MSGVALSHKYRGSAIFGDERVLSVAAASECTDSCCSQAVIAITAAVYFRNKVFGGQIIQKIHYLELLNLTFHADQLAYLFIVKWFLGRGLKNGHYGMQHGFFLHALSFSLFRFVFSIVLFPGFVFRHIFLS